MASFPSIRKLTLRTEILSTPSFSSRPFSTPLVSEMFSLNHWISHPLVSHLVFESQLFGLLSAISVEFQRMRIEEYQPTRISLIEYAWQDLDRDFAGWRERVACADSEYMLNVGANSQSPPANGFEPFHCIYRSLYRSKSLRTCASALPRPSSTMIFSQRSNVLYPTSSSFLERSYHS
jgi:hypothetical protein